MAETWLDRGTRLARDVTPYIPGPTLDDAARRARTTPARIAKLSSNESPLGPSPRAVAAIRRLARRVHLYPNAQAPALTAAIARYVGARAEQVVVGGGSSTLMHAIVAAFTTPGGEVVTFAPSFTVYAELAAVHGRTAVTLPLRERDFALDIERLAEAITPRTQLVFVARPNNPTSTLAPLAQLDAVAELAGGVGALVVSDEAYLEFADAPSRETGIGLVVGDEPRHPNVVVTRTFSKAFGLADLRLGYAVATAETARYLRLANAKWPTGAMAEAAGIAALADRRHLARVQRVVREGRAWLARELVHRGFPVAPDPQGNYVMIDVAACGFTPAAFADGVLALGRVVVRGDFSDRHVRITVGRPADNRRFVAAVTRLTRARTT